MIKLHVLMAAAWKNIINESTKAIHRSIWKALGRSTWLSAILRTSISLSFMRLPQSNSSEKDVMVA